MALASAGSAFTVPASVTVPQGASSASFNISTVASASSATGTLSATYAGVTRSTSLTVQAVALSLSIADATITEGTSGTSPLVFTVTLSRASTEAVSYNITTVDGTANAGSDYVARSLVGETIPAGQTSRSFLVTVNGDNERELDESFSVVVSAVAGATQGDLQATGTLRSDDARVMSSPLPARPGTGPNTPQSSAAPAIVSANASLCLWRTPVQARQCLRQVPTRWLQGWRQLRLWLAR